MYVQNISNNTSLTLSATDAGKQFGYTNDYITRLAREKKILAKRVGRQWYVDPVSVENFIASAEKAKKAQAEKIRLERKREQVVVSRGQSISFVPMVSKRAVAVTKAGLLLGVGGVVGIFLFTFTHTLPLERQAMASSAGVLSALRDMASWMYSFGFGSSENTETQAVAGPAELPAENVFETVGSSSGLVVLPADSTLTLEEVAQSFSDHVIVEKDPDGKSGIITPSFQSGTSTSYRFLLVPMHPP